MSSPALPAASDLAASHRLALSVLAQEIDLLLCPPEPGAGGRGQHSSAHASSRAHGHAENADPALVSPSDSVAL